MQINVLEYFEHGSLVNFPNKTAVVDPERQYTFHELETYAKKCAALILANKDILNHPIAVYLPKSANTIIADLGILYSGNIYTNLDIKSPAQRIKNILGNINPVLIITSKEHEASVISLEINPDHIFIIDEVYYDEINYDNGAIIKRLDSVIDTDPLCIINTSGSTGTPKGVSMSHRSVIDFMDWVMNRFSLDENTITGSLSPFYFDIYTLELYLSLAKGATLVIIPDQAAIFPTKLVDFLQQNEINFIFWVPTIMVNIANHDLLKELQLNHLRTVFFAGEVFPTKHLNYWRKHIPEALFVNLYGPIEITVDCTYYVVDRELMDDEALPIGVPCRNTDILILDEDNELAKTNQPGELCIRGSSLALGYWNDPDKTNKAFVQNPLNTSYPERIYRTGDLVYRNDQNEIMFAGRKDFQIKHLGYRIELGEIEHLVVSLNAIKNACVLYNQEKKEITLFYETPDDDASQIYIRQELLKILPKYMLPTVFHRLDVLPRNPNGKIDRNKLSSFL